MSTRARTWSLFLVALVLLGGTSWMAHLWTSRQRAAEALEPAPLAVPTPSQSILTARKAIRRGQILSDSDFGWQPWPENGLDKAYVLIGTRSANSFSGYVAVEPLAPGEPITEAKIVPPGSRGFLAAVLHPGMRAISLQVTAESGAAGFISPGDRVDLLLTILMPASGHISCSECSASQTNQAIARRGTQTLLQNLLVLAVDQKLQTNAGETVLAHTVTLEAMPKQVEIINVADALGKFSLALRSLVPGGPEASVQSEKPSADPAPEPDASITLDSDLMPAFATASRPGVDAADGEVTILRGKAPTSTTTVVQP